MAEGSSLTQELNCSICLGLLSEPVTLSGCFHSFCKECLEQNIQLSPESYRNPYICPICKRRFSPSEAQRVNHHLQNIVESHKRQAERTPEVTSDRSRDAANDIEKLTTVLSTAEAFVQTLVTVMDQASVRVGSIQTTRVLDQDNESYDSDSYLETYQELDTVSAGDHGGDCEFEAATLQEFKQQSLAVCRRHFILIMFMIHVSIFAVCLFQAIL